MLKEKALSEELQDKIANVEALRFILKGVMDRLNLLSEYDISLDMVPKVTAWIASFSEIVTLLSKQVEEDYRAEIEAMQQVMQQVMQQMDSMVSQAAEADTAQAKE